jgi:hypothetical protein
MSPADPTPATEDSLGARLFRVASDAIDVVFGAEKIPPSACTKLRVTELSSTHLTLAWTAPVTGTLPIKYTVFVKLGTAEFWSVGAETLVTMATVDNLKPNSLYFFEVLANNR